MFKNPLPKARPEQIADELHLREKRPVNEMSVRNPCARNELGPNPELRREDAHRKTAVSHHTVKEPTRENEGRWATSYCKANIKKHQDNYAEETW